MNLWKNSIYKWITSGYNGGNFKGRKGWFWDGKGSDRCCWGRKRVFHDAVLPAVGEGEAGGGL